MRLGGQRHFPLEQHAADIIVAQRGVALLVAPHDLALGALQVENFHLRAVAVEQVQGAVAHLRRQVRRVPHKGFVLSQQGLGPVDGVMRSGAFILSMAQAQGLAGCLLYTSPSPRD